VALTVAYYFPSMLSNVDQQSDKKT